MRCVLLLVSYLMILRGVQLELFGPFGLMILEFAVAEALPFRVLNSISFT